MADGNTQLLQGLASLLQQAATAPDQLQDAASALNSMIGNTEQVSGAASGSQGSTTDTIADLLTGIAGALKSAGGQQPPPQSSSLPSDGQTAAADLGPLPTVEEFVIHNSLEPWVTDALHMLRQDQLEHVIRKPLNLENTNNLNGVVTSRIKEVCPVDQRLQIFIQLNGLADGVIDRLSTLTPEQHERVMESTLKVQKANNPSGVVMRRITDVLKAERMGSTYGRPAQYGSQSFGSLADRIGNMAAAGRDRSRSRPPLGFGGGGGATPQSYGGDIDAFIQTYNLEWWVGEVLSRLSLLQRQEVTSDMRNMHGVRNPSGIVMTRVKQVVQMPELVSIFIDINGIEQAVAADLWQMTDEQQAAVIAPGIYIQNARSSSTACRSRIRQVLAGNDAMGGPARYRADYGRNSAVRGQHFADDQQYQGQQYQGQQYQGHFASSLDSVAPRM
eukprot:TRINITY_DN2138_c0_g1_i1.p1 TRINITY_DN2138_c0_g1~~TRINITY_DN2138_c0_g1_i1.p1  ORF type:complete len:445 (-),score=89.93 TRINITY_DN2138_c0_g1_i1:193-1527(-)